MKRQYILSILILCILMLYLVGCKNRQVTSLIDPSVSTDLSPITESSNDLVEVEEIEETPTLPTETQSSSTTAPTDIDEEPVASIPDSTNEGTNPSNSSEALIDIPKEDPDTPTIIIAESEAINAVDDRAVLLNELDALLDGVLTSLDALENQTLTEDVTDLGGQ